MNLDGLRAGSWEEKVNIIMETARKSRVKTVSGKYYQVFSKQRTTQKKRKTVVA